MPLTSPVERLTAQFRAYDPMADSPESPDARFRGIPEDDDVEANGGAVRWTPSKSIMPAAEQRVREIEEAVAGLGALEEPDADVKARMAKLNVEAAELRIVIARAHRAKTPRDRALADEIRKLELELGVAKKGQAVANREKKASQKGYSVSIDEEDPHARSGLTPPPGDLTAHFAQALDGLPLLGSGTRQ